MFSIRTLVNPFTLNESNKSVFKKVRSACPSEGKESLCKQICEQIVDGWGGQLYIYMLKKDPEGLNQREEGIVL